MISSYPRLVHHCMKRIHSERSPCTSHILMYEQLKFQIHFFSPRFTPCKDEPPIKGMEVQEREVQKD